jgi:hypothetical protein
MKIIEINRKFYSVPESWNELGKKQLLQVMQLFYSTKYSAEQAQLKLLKILTGMSWWSFFRAPITTTERVVINPFKISLSWGTYLFKCRRTCYGLDEYIYLINFLLKENKLTKNLVPQYKDFYGPAGDCNNLRMNEFVFSEHYYMQWTEKKDDDKLLNNLVAVLYRLKKDKYDLKKNEDGDPRIAFNENLCEYFATSQVYAWPKKLKLAIAHFYEACRIKLVDDNAEVFGGDGEPAKHGLVSIMIAVAESNAFGPFKEVEQLHVNMVMIQLKEQIEKVRQAKENLPAAS